MGRLLHRALDAAGWAALDCDRDPGRRPSTTKPEDFAVSYDQKPSVVLAKLCERQSGKGNAYFSSFLGNVSIALLRDGERPHPTREGETVTVWKLVAQERDRPPKPPAEAARARSAGRTPRRPQHGRRLLRRPCTALPARERGSAARAGQR
jgi:hypothetical protein